MTILSAQRFSTFDPRKAIAAVSYLVEKTSESLYIIMKMMYLADKVHLDRYGRFIAGDWYVAMKKGPVPSETYSLLTSLREGDQRHHSFATASKSMRVHDDYTIESIGRTAFDELSDSDVECLDVIVESYRHVGKWAIRDMSHDEVWERAWRRKSIFSKRAPMPMDQIAEHVGDANLVAHVRDPNPGSA